MTTYIDAAAALQLFPGMRIAFLIGPAKLEDETATEEVSDRVVNRTRATHGSAEALRDSPLVEAYREFYAAMNVRPSSASTPVKQALRIFEKGYRPIHPVVDVSMEIEYVSLCSFQVYDWERLGSHISYGPATGTEEVSERAHGGGACRIRAGELILRDENGVINSPTCGNQADRVVSASTDHVMVRILKIPAIDNQAFMDSVTESSRRFTSRHVVVLDADTPSARVVDDHLSI